MTRHGKIARVPRAVREELNLRLANGELGMQLVAWLNGLPEVRAVLAAQFGGRAITEQNLSVWKQGGFEDWQRHQEARAWVGQLAEESDDLEAESGAIRLAERAAVPVVVEVVKLLQQACTTGDPVEQRKAVLGAAQQIVQLRRGNHEAERVRLEQERWEMKKEELRAMQQEKEAAAARWARVRPLLFPDVDEDGIPRRRGELPTDLQACLAANARLRGEARVAANPSESK